MSRRRGKRRRRKNRSGMLLGIVIAAVIFVIAIVVFILYIAFSNNTPDDETSQAVTTDSQSVEAYQSTELKETTEEETTSIKETTDAETTENSTTEPESTGPVPVREAADISIVAVGDNLIHSQIFESILKPDGGYDFSAMYDQGVINTLSSADMTIINQETPAFGNQHGVSTYPCFNAPTETIDSIINVLGADVLTLATNHSMDKEDAGLLGTLDYIHTNYPQVLTTGTFSSYEDSVATPIYEVKGVKIAVLNYTYGLNGNAPAQSYEINLLTDLPKIEADMARAREEADFIIVYPHWGTEYTQTVDANQLQYAQYFADIGADLIIGAHPHVTQPVTMITAADGRQVPCYYSLGNFLSAQNVSPRTLGGIAKIGLHVDEFGDVSITGMDYDFVYTYYQVTDWIFHSFKLYMLRDVPQELEASSGIKLWSPEFTIQQYVDIARGFNPNWAY